MKKLYITGKYTFETIPQALARSEGYWVVPETGRKFVILQREGNRYVDFNTGSEIPAGDVNLNGCDLISAGDESSQFWIYKDPVLGGFIRNALGRSAEDLCEGGYFEVPSKAMEEMLKHLLNLWDIPVENFEARAAFIKDKLLFREDDAEEEKCHIEMFLSDLRDILEQLERFMERAYDSFFVTCAVK